MKRFCVVIFSLILLMGCGGGSSTDAPSISKVTYSDRAGMGTVENYTNAEWLYKNYLGEYGLPAEVKPQFMPAIKMLANGFALQLKRGDDVKASIEHFHQQFLQFAASGQATSFVKAMAEAPNQASTPTTTPIDPLELAKDYIPLPMTDEEKKAVAEAYARDEQLRTDIKKIAAEYGLPYTIDGRDEQWFIYTPTMKGGKGGGSGSSSAPKQHPDINTWQWRMGDIIWSNGETGTGIPGHVGLISTVPSKSGIIDANTPGVVYHSDRNSWARKYTVVRAYSPKLNWTDPSYYFNPYNGEYYPRDWLITGGAHSRAMAVSYARNAIGMPYNWNFLYALDESKYYCSSLIWNAYYRWGHWNIWDPFFPLYGLVIYPSDVTNSRTTEMFNSSSL